MRAFLLAMLIEADGMMGDDKAQAMSLTRRLMQ